jgi:hypothetical protein
MYTIDTALVYDLFPSTISPEFQNAYEGRDNEVKKYVLITNDGRYVFVEGAPSPEMTYYGRALVGDGQGEYAEFNAYSQGQATIDIPLWTDNNVDITEQDDQMERQFYELFLRTKEEERANEGDCEDRCQGCDCEDEICGWEDVTDVTERVESAVYRARGIMRQLEEVLENHINRKSGEGNPLVVPTISEAAADHLYNQVSQLHDDIAGLLKR